MLAFAANSLLCRAALQSGRLDAATFTSTRLLAGAATLWLLVRLRGRAAGTSTSTSTRTSTSAVGTDRASNGNWPSALALFVYAAAFSFSYLSLPTGTGALLLFGAVQATMLGAALWRGERLRGPQLAGLALALAGLLGLLWPGLAAPPWPGASLMLVAGAAWGVYSLRGQGSGDPLRVTAGNFLRALAFAAVLSATTATQRSLDGPGLAFAVASGALASGLGYAVWYAVLPALRVSTAATLQLSVPVLAALGGIALLGEAPGWRLALAAAAVLGGIALVVMTGPRRVGQAPRARVPR